MRRLTIGPIHGVRVMVHPSWLLVLAVIVLALPSTAVPGQPPLPGPLGVLMAAAVAGGFFMSVLAHELAHALVARRIGLPVDEIGLFVFGGQTQREHHPPTARAELLIAAAGPLLSVVLGSAILALYSVLPPASDVTNVLRAICWWIGAGNLLLGVLNLVPSYPLDGGRLVRAVAWLVTDDARRGLDLATTAGRAFGYALVAVGLYLAVVGDLISGIWLLVLGILLNQAARFHQRRIEVGHIVEGLTVADLMERDVAVVGPNLTLDTLYEQHQRVGTAELYPVTAHGALVGSINIQQILRVPRTSWPRTRVTDVMTEAEQLQPVTGRTSALDALHRFDRSRTPAIPVVDEGDHNRLVGLLTRDRLLEKLRAHARRVGDEERAADERRAAGEP